MAGIHEHLKLAQMSQSPEASPSLMLEANMMLS